MAEVKPQLIVLITGANQGLGYHTAQALAATGLCHVLVGARSPVKSAQAIASLTSDVDDPVPAEALSPINIDLTSDASINMAVLYVEKNFGRLDILINNAAISSSSVRAPSLREQYIELFNTNVFGTAVVTQAFLPLLRASTYERRRIVNVSSGLGSLTLTKDPSSTSSATLMGLHTYRASKAAVNMLTLTDADQLHADGIEVVSVCPGHLKTNLNGYTGAKDPHDGAAAVVRAATAQGLNGKFVTDESPDGFWPW